jgi:hypothetical protein
VVTYACICDEDRVSIKAVMKEDSFTIQSAVYTSVSNLSEFESKTSYEFFKYDLAVFIQLVELHIAG